MSIRCVVGLGNPGSRYEWTRHSVGFQVVDRLAEIGRLRWRRTGDSLEAGGEIEGRRLVLIKPQTFMNASGGAVLGCMDRHLLTPSETLVVVDDVALPAGRLRLRPSGSDGGHRGLASIVEALGTSGFPRLRIGVGDAGEEEDLAEFVLRPLEGEERVLFQGIIERAVEAVLGILGDGITRTMNRVNPAPPGDDSPIPPDRER